MSEAQFMGLLIGGIATLLTIASIITAIIIVPVIKLNKTIQKLSDSIDNLNGANYKIEKRLDAHGSKLDEHEKILTVHGEQIKHLNQNNFRQRKA